MNKNLFKLSFPSKTFLIGEYAVLDKGCAVLVNTHPCFYFDVNLESDLEVFDFHSESIASFLIQKNQKFFSNVSIRSFNPHKQLSGFGLSSAELNCAYWVSQYKKNQTSDLKSQTYVKQMFEFYQKLHQKKDMVASGVDALSQWVGDVCLYQANPFFVRSCSWRFQNLQFALVRVQKKHQTADHLKNLKRKNFSKLKKISKKTLASWECVDSQVFIDSLNEYANELKNLGLVTKNTLMFLNEFKKNKNILASKGCGALGAELILLIFNKHDQEKVLQSLKDYSVSLYHLSRGIQVECI